MNFAKQADRFRYIVAEPGHFLRLVHATAANRVHGLTQGFGPRRVACNLCGWQGRHFDYYLERHFVVKNEQCPGCRSHERNRELVNFIVREFDLLDRQILDIAPSPGYREWFEKRNARYVSVDRGERSSMATMDVVEMAFPDESFDLVICSHVLEHVREYRAALFEIGRMLKNDGVGLLDVPFSREYESYELEKLGRQGHVHEFGVDIIGKIEDCGFVVDVKRYSAEKDQDDLTNQFFAVRKKPKSDR